MVMVRGRDGRTAESSLRPNSPGLELISVASTDKPRATGRYYQTLMKIATNLISVWMELEERPDK